MRRQHSVVDDGQHGFLAFSAAVDLKRVILSAAGGIHGWIIGSEIRKRKMVTLKEHIEIPAPYERLQAWADNFQEEFVRWSPYHTECEMYDGGYEKGMRVRFREIVGGLDYNVTGTISECEKDSGHFRIVFESDRKTSFIVFEGKRTETGCSFTHTESFGLSTPVIGPVLEFLTFKVFYRKWCNWELIREDMILDNQYLRDILVDGRYPERMTMEELLSRKA